MQFEEEIRGGAIPREFIPAVEKGIQDALVWVRCPAYPVVDVKVTLVDGRYHEVDSSEMAFRIAGSMATKSAIDKAGPLRLEPVMKLEIATPGEFLGDVLGDLGRRRAPIRSIEGLATSSPSGPGFHWPRASGTRAPSGPLPRESVFLNGVRAIREGGRGRRSHGRTRRIAGVMVTQQRIRIILKAFDHRILDLWATQIVRGG